MKLLPNSNHIDKEMKRLMRNYSKYSWAVAWASTSYRDGFELLKQNRDKIKRLVVGIHFYQTHPDFIREFMKLQSVKFVMSPDGVFHPKVYLFESKNGKWECIIGSPNFTQSAINKNSEAAVLFSSKDLDADDIYEEIINNMEQYWEQGRYLSESELTSYRNVWKRKQKLLNRVSGQYGSSGPVKKSPMDVDIFKMSWQNFFKQTEEDPEHSLEGRLDVLNAAKNLFESYAHFKDMDVNDRREIAGFGPQKEINWHWFGSTTTAGKFKHEVLENNKHLSLALDQIPLHGDITENHYRECQKEFSQVKGVGIGSATRLLAMKRPDYFICLNSKNKEALCSAFDISKNIKLSNYWKVIIERIVDCVWWSSEQPTNDKELAVWKGRAAFLDSLYYDPS